MYYENFERLCKTNSAKLQMDEVLERLQRLVNLEIDKRHCTVKKFAIDCEISYNEMRLIVNGNIRDIRLSTIFQICMNTDINICDLFIVGELECIFNNITITYQGQRYSTRVSRYR